MWCTDKSQEEEVVEEVKRLVGLKITPSTNGVSVPVPPSVKRWDN